MRRVIGIHSCRETLSVRPKTISKIYLKKDWKSSQDLQFFERQAKLHGIKLEVIATGFLDKWGSGHQGVGLEVTDSPHINWELLGQNNQILLALDSIEDPHNLGAILRTAWLMGVAGLIIPKSRAVSLTPVVCKVASGGGEHVPVEEVSNLLATLKDLKDKGFWIYGLSEKASQSMWKVRFNGPLVLVVGAEGQGLKKQHLDFCDELVQIPQKQAQASYNASVAAGLVMAEVLRQFQA